MWDLGVIGHAAGAVLFTLLALVLLTGQWGRQRKRLLFFAAAASALWMGAAAASGVWPALGLWAQLLEVLRDYTWILLLVHLLSGAYGQASERNRYFETMAAMTAAGALLVAALTLYRAFLGRPVVGLVGVDWTIAAYLVTSVIGLVLVEQLLRNTRRDAYRYVKFLCFGLGGIFAFDFALYAHGLLFQEVNYTLWQARGAVNALTVPVIAYAIARDNRTAPDIFVSRRVVFHTATLLATGLYLLTMGVGGYYVREYGGSWGAVAEVIFIFGALLLLGLLLFSTNLRASLRVFINKHFFHYKYDYRDEWLRLIRTLSSGEPGDELRRRIVQAIAEIIDSPGGVLWMRRDRGHYQPVESWHATLPEGVREPVDSELVKLLAEQEWVVNLDEYEENPGLYGDMALPDWAAAMPRAWLIVPLIFHDNLLGFIVLERAPAHSHFNWEDCDLLKTAGRQAASHLAQLEVARALGEARQFEACSRMSTYVIHDLKNLISQLSLVVSNAGRHMQNPAFMEDAIRTVDNCVTKMNGLLAHLRGHGVAGDAETVVLDALVEDVARTMAAGRPVPEVDLQARGLQVQANRERLAAVVGHVVRNAQDATPDDGRIHLRVFKAGADAVIEVQDTGSGMDEAFIRERLFRPFDTTKGSKGMGIGVYETREFVRSIGGDVEVVSRVGEGTTFRLRLPISGASGNSVELGTVPDTSGSADDRNYKEIAGR